MPVDTSLKNVAKKAVFNWSGGKDSALALQKVLEEEEYEVISLLTTIHKDSKTSSMHAIPVEILQLQAESIAIPIHFIYLSENLRDYDKKMLEAVLYFKEQQVTHFIFGDLFLSDIKQYREQKLLPFGIEVVEPLWGKTSEEVMELFLDSGLKAKIILIQDDKMKKEFVGKELSRSLIDLFPKQIDICGEYGEYHTLCFAGGIFRKEVPFTIASIYRVSHNITLENGTIQQFDYWVSKITS